MKQRLEEWLHAQPAVRGVKSWGIRFPDKSSINQSFTLEFPEVAMENAWRCVADTYQVLVLHRFPAARMRWVYEHSILACARREDGLFVGLFTEKDPGQTDLEGVEHMMNEFQAFPGKWNSPAS